MTSENSNAGNIRSLTLRLSSHALSSIDYRRDGKVKVEEFVEVELRDNLSTTSG